MVVLHVSHAENAPVVDTIVSLQTVSETFADSKVTAYTSYHDPLEIISSKRPVLEAFEEAQERKGSQSQLKQSRDAPLDW